MKPKICEGCVFDNLHCAKQVKLAANSEGCGLRVASSKMNKLARTKEPIQITYPDLEGGRIVEVH